MAAPRPASSSQSHSFNSTICGNKELADWLCELRDWNKELRRFPAAHRGRGFLGEGWASGGVWVSQVWVQGLALPPKGWVPLGTDGCFCTWK